MGRENMITFGKITIVSSGEPVEKLIEHLDNIISKHGYPGQYDHGDDSDDADLNDIEDELKSDAEKENPDLGFNFKKKMEDAEEYDDDDD